MALTWCLPGQASWLSIAVLKRVQLAGALVPSIWHIEMANILGLKMRDGFLSQRELQDSLALLRLLAIATDGGAHELRIESLLPLMGKYRLPAYDAIYLDLALRNGLPLATFDKEMIESARQNGVTLASFS
jgi:predicted nucleic acid-binding protein